MDLPEDLYYTREHEWAKVDEKKKTATIGITDYAQEKLGDVVYVELPDEGDSVVAGESFGSVESVKAVSDLFAPVTGKVTEINDAILDSPEVVNDDPYGEAWMIRVSLTTTVDYSKLMNAADYRKFIESQEAES